MPVVIDAFCSSASPLVPIACSDGGGEQLPSLTGSRQVSRTEEKRFLSGCEPLIVWRGCSPEFDKKILKIRLPEANFERAPRHVLCFAVNQSTRRAAPPTRLHRDQVKRPLAPLLPPYTIRRASALPPLYRQQHLEPLLLGFTLPLSGSANSFDPSRRISSCIHHPAAFASGAVQASSYQHAHHLVGYQ